MVQFLLKNNCPVNKYGAMGDTPIMVAIKKKNVDLVNTIISHGADLFRTNHSKEDSFDIALRTALSKPYKAQSDEMTNLSIIATNFCTDPLLSLKITARRSFWTDSFRALHIISRLHLPKEIFFFLIFLNRNCSEEIKDGYLKLFGKL